jgi:hypothetical protein
MSNLLSGYLEVIKAAQQQMHFEDFKTGGRLAGDIRRGYQARMAAFRDLQSQGFVALESSRMALGELTPVPWLTNALQGGITASWEICDAFPLRSRKFKPDVFNLEQIGLEGELFVIECLRQHFDENSRMLIEHTSLADDSAGFDVASPNSSNNSRIFLEVKTTTRPGDHFTFHLSRNEWNTASRKKNWFLVLVTKVEGEHEIFGHLDGRSLVNYYPRDAHPNFQWESVIGKLASDDVFSGLPGF